MRRVIVPLALVLALITGVVLDATRLVVVFPTATDNGQMQARVATELVQRFYDAINMSVEIGDVSELEQLLAADFVDHAVHPGMTPDRAGMLTTVRMLHEIAPTLRLVAKNVVAEHDRVAVQVEIEGLDAADFLGIPISADRLWGASDVFRVVAGQLVDRWGDTARTVGLDPLFSNVVSLTPPSRSAVTLERWTYAPGLRESWANDRGTSVFLVDAESLTLAHRRDGREVRWGDETGADQPSPTSSSAVNLLTGDAVVVAQGDQVVLHNEGTVPTVVLVVSLAMLPPTAVDDAAPTGITHTMVAAGPATDLSASQYRIAIGRVTMPPGSMFPPHSVEVAEAVTVEAGRLAVTAEGNVWVTSVPNTMAHRADGQPVPTNGGAIIPAGTVAGYGVAGNTPLTLLVVTVA